MVILFSQQGVCFIKIAQSRRRRHRLQSLLLAELAGSRPRICRLRERVVFHVHRVVQDHVEALGLFLVKPYRCLPRRGSGVHMGRHLLLFLECMRICREIRFKLLILPWLLVAEASSVELGAHRPIGVGLHRSVCVDHEIILI